MGARIRFVQEKVGGSSALNKLSGVSASQLSRLIRNEIPNPGLNQIQSIAKAGDVPLVWLVEGGEQSGVEGETKSNGFVPISYFDNGKSPVMLERSYLVNEIQSNPDHCVMFQSGEDSMASTISKGDKVLIDTSRTSGDGIFLVKIENNVFLKRLQWLPGAGVDVISDNSSYKSYQLKPEMVEVIGQVVWIGSRY
ncbi:hypothetical protein GZ77_03750 [Endozoicomonas montiporae]|uniref:HTH cro/C1-type domain-containing protein n=2 Tax=Endozoicomonas montiporae TaxID=1027273 RepID=A0A081NB73_9GAMM|nr:hypothetical protein GZ77_03750 [Endozoicomonas montiporae]